MPGAENGSQTGVGLSDRASGPCPHPCSWSIWKEPLALFLLFCMGHNFYIFKHLLESVYVCVYMCVCAPTVWLVC